MISTETLAEMARTIEANKPYLLAVEDEVQRVAHGEVTIRFEVRNGNVEKMQFIDAKRNWLREKAQQNPQVKETVIFGFIKSVQAV